MPRYIAPEEDNVSAILRDIRELLNNPDRVTDIDIDSVLVTQNVNVAILSDRNRVSISFFNSHATNTVWVLATDEYGTNHGMPIPPGSERELGTSQALWLRNENVTPVRVHIQDEKLPY